MKTAVFLIASLFLLRQGFAQNSFCLAFYNQENLFDTIDDPHKNDNEFLPGSKNNWNSTRYLDKLTHMAEVISAMNQANGPDVLGVCEIENRAVLQDLCAQAKLKSCNYGIVHFESPDERSIDNALLYKQSKFKVIRAIPYPIRIDSLPHFKTRDILMVQLQVQSDNKAKSSLVVLVNHFPSRSGGQGASEFKRYRAATILRHIFDSIQQVSPGQAVIAMGDFNDEPTDPSMDSILGATPDVNSTLYNPMYALKESGQGSYLYRKHWDMLDQFILNKALTQGKNTWRYQSGSAGIFKEPWMLETEPAHAGAPKRTFAGGKYLNGYSDHLPVFLYLNTGN